MFIKKQMLFFGMVREKLKVWPDSRTWLYNMPTLTNDPNFSRYLK